MCWDRVSWLAHCGADGGGVASLMKYFIAAIGGAIALTLSFHSTDHGVMVMAAKYAGDEPQLIKFMGDMGYPKFGEWCGEFAASIIKRAGGNPPSGAAVASNWRNYGTPDAMPRVGDVAVADRGVPTGALGSHVGFVSGVDLETGTFTLESGNSCNIFTARKINRFSFRTPPNNVLSELTGNSVYLELQSIRHTQACHSVAPPFGAYPFVRARLSPRCNLKPFALWSLRVASLTFPYPTKHSDGEAYGVPSPP
jgi:uncharacterized protein (TIGR02594 family)